MLSIILCLTLATVPAKSQEVQEEDYPLLDVSQLDEKYGKWLVEEVGRIITDDEREIFLRLDIDAKRDRFIERFWAVRDPTPGTRRNEYAELHYERLEYVNRFFGRGTSSPGWRTDRGRIYILLGEPISRSRLPNSMSTYPADVWFYQADPGLGIPPFFYVLFFQPYGNGDYRLYSPISDGPRKLLNPSGEREVQELLASDRPLRGFAPSGFGDLSAVYEVLRAVDSDLASAAISLYPSEAGMEYGISPLKSEMLIAEIHEIPEKIMPDAGWAVAVLTGYTEAEVRFETLPMKATAIGLLDPSGLPFIYYAALTSGRQLNLNRHEGRTYFTFEVSGSLTDPEQRVLQSFQNHMEGDLNEDNVRSFRSNPFAFMDLLPAIPGPQTLDLVLENNVTREFGRATFELVVPAPHPERLTAAGLLLCSEVTRVPEYDPFSPFFPFQFGELLLVPNIDGSYANDTEIITFHQILLPPGHSEPVSAAYVLLNERGVAVREQTVSIDPQQASGFGTIEQITAIELDGLQPGHYTLRVEIDGARSTAPLPITVTEPAPEAGHTFINAQPAPPPNDPSFALERAYQYRTLGRTAEAIAWLETALRRAPEMREALELQAELLMEAGRYEELDELLIPRLVQAPNNLGLLMTLAEANARLGRHYNAIRYFERARLTVDDETPELLNALASEYYADGNIEKTRELIERSLSLDPEQPEIQRLLEQVLHQRQPPGRRLPDREVEGR